jgi:glycosyltransferase involved in cell wall biosynthesis
MAHGLPVRFCVDASREIVDARLRRADIVWQATGWGSSAERQPESFEHFGIGLVEAMSAGAVPVAIDTGGAAEIVRDGRSGMLWNADEGPVPATLRLIRDPEMLAAQSREAVARAGDFGFDRFRARVAGELQAVGA